MKAFVIAFVVLLVLGVVLFIIAKLWNPRLTIGGPTPEEARVTVDKAEDRAKKENDATVEEVKNAPLDENMRRARDLIRRGMHGK